MDKMAANKGGLNRGGAVSFLTLGPDSSVTARYHSDFGPHNDLILLEAPDDAILNDLLHGRVTIRGQDDVDAVLCTPSSTYAMKFVSTSNSVFLIPPGKPNLSDPQPDPLVSVLKLASGNIELVQIAPQLDKLRFLLMQRLYKLDEEDLSSEGLYTWHVLICSIQASDEELREGLRFLSAVEIDGFWRMVHPKSVNMILTMVLTNSVLHDRSLDALVEEEVLSVLDSDGFNFTIGATIVDLSVTITPVEKYQLPLEAYKQLMTEEKASATESSAVRKAEDVVSSMLAKGYVLSKDALNVAKSFDERHQLLSNASATVASLHRQTGLSDKISAGTALFSGKMHEVDEHFQVLLTVHSASGANPGD